MNNKFLKRPLVTAVEFADNPGVLNTLEGAVPYQTGDALMTGVSGERWPISRARFDSTYNAVPPTLHGESGAYIKKSIPVTAVQISEIMLVALSGTSASISGKMGDWLISAPDGSQWVVDDVIFKKTYQQI
jgi:hypothetical protein